MFHPSLPFISKTHLREGIQMSILKQIEEG
jgi:hypothetical protein